MSVCLCLCVSVLVCVLADEWGMRSSQGIGVLDGCTDWRYVCTSAHQLHDSVMLGLASVSLCFTEPPAAH